MSPVRHPVRTRLSLPQHASALLIGSLCLALLPALAQAQYKWKDSRGQVHVSDLPPPREVPEKDILQRPAARPGSRPAPAALAGDGAASAAASAPAPARAPQDPELEARRKKQEQEARNQQRADEERQARLRAENCERARQSVTTLESGQRIFRVNAQGERELLDDATRNADLARARAALEANCR